MMSAILAMRSIIKRTIPVTGFAHPLSEGTEIFSRNRRCNSYRFLKEEKSRFGIGTGKEEGSNGKENTSLPVVYARHKMETSVGFRSSHELTVFVLVTDFVQPMAHRKKPDYTD
jgi:hypothetical protein